MTGEQRLKAFAETSYKKTLTKVNHHIYHFLGYGISNSIAVIGDTSVILIDALDCPDYARELKRELAELTDKPVLGIAESAIAAAKMIAPCFSVVSVLDRSVKVTADVVSAYGAAPFCRSIRSTGLSVLDFGKDTDRGLSALAEQSRRAVAEDKAECVLLGCAGFVDFVEKLQRELGVPVLDGVSPAVRFAEALVGLGLRTSKVNT